MDAVQCGEMEEPTPGTRADVTESAAGHGAPESCPGREASVDTGRRESEPELVPRHLPGLARQFPEAEILGRRNVPEFVPGSAEGRCRAGCS